MKNPAEDIPRPNEPEGPITKLANMIAGDKKRTSRQQRRLEAHVERAVRSAKNLPRRNTPKADRQRPAAVERPAPNPELFTTMAGHRPRPPKKRKR